jgi:hypothetical protein
MDQPGQWLLTATVKYGELGMDEKCSLFGGDNAPTLYRNLQKMFLAYRERDTLQSLYPPLSTVMLSTL